MRYLNETTNIIDLYNARKAREIGTLTRNPSLSIESTKPFIPEHLKGKTPPKTINEHMISEFLAMTGAPKEKIDHEYNNSNEIRIGSELGMKFVTNFIEDDENRYKCIIDNNTNYKLKIVNEAYDKYGKHISCMKALYVAKEQADKFNTIKYNEYIKSECFSEFKDVIFNKTYLKFVTNIKAEKSDSWYEALKKMNIQGSITFHAYDDDGNIVDGYYGLYIDKEFIKGDIDGTVVDFISALAQKYFDEKNN